MSSEAASNSPGTSLATTKSGALTIYDRIVDPMAFIDKLGAIIYGSKMFQCANADQGKALALAFAVKRIDPFDFRRRHHLIGGNLTMTTEAMLADFRTQLGGDHTIIRRDAEKAAVELVLKKKKQMFEYTLEEALQEDYVYTQDANNGKIAKKLPDGKLNPLAMKDNWSTPRRRMQMLWARVVSDAVGAMAPEISGGRLTPEEVGAPSAGSSDHEVPNAGVKTDDHGEVIDAEFEVVVDTPKPDATPAGTPPAAATEEKPAEYQKIEPLTEPTQEELKTSILQRLGPLKRELLTDEEYKSVLAKPHYNVTTARDLTVEQLTKLVTGLETRQAAKGNDVNKWVSDVQNGGASSGN